MTDFVDLLFDTKSMEERYELMREANRKGFTITDEERIAKGKDKNAVRAILLKDEIVAVKDEMGDNFYSRRGNEALADQIPTRLGYGNDLSKFLKDSSVQFGAEFSLTRRLVLSICSLILLSNPILAIVYMMTWFIEPDGTYDKPVKRVDVIRQQLSYQLRSTRLSTEQKKRIIEDIDKIELAWKDAVEFYSMGEIVWASLIARRRANEAKFQQRLESLSHTRLNEAAARVEVL